MRTLRLTLDTREPDPHPWEPFLPSGWTMTRAGMETGDLCVTALPDGAIVERKTPADLAGCIGSGRERFERELRRGRYCGRLVVVIEGSLSDVCTAARAMNHNAVVGSIAAWTLRYCPFVFTGSPRAAADFAFRFLASQVRDIQRAAETLKAPPDQ